MRKRRCNPPWDHMNKSAYHPVLLYRGIDRLEEYAHRETYTNTCIHSTCTHAEEELKNMDYAGVIGVKHQ